jgi:UDP-3-O-[3-hydroxymyristoyl] glucosamine N-acyltransferase
MTTAAIADLVQGKLRGPGGLAISGLETLELARPGDLTFIGDAKHAGLWASSRASAALVTKGVDIADASEGERALIVVESADLAMATVLERFAPPAPAPEIGLHPTAFVEESAVLGDGVRIGAFVYVGPEAVIGDGVTLHARATVLDGAIIGADSVLWPGAVVRERCLLGKRVVLHAGAIIGADGFGYRPLPDGSGIRHIPHIGHVELGDDVEVGANAAIDRGKFGATSIGAGTKIDNLVQIGHNCRIGRLCMISGQSGLSGSITVGDGVLMGGGAGIADHVSIGAGARIAARSGVSKNIPPGETWAGYPARPFHDMYRILAMQSRMLGEKRRRTSES